MDVAVRCVACHRPRSVPVAEDEDVTGLLVCGDCRTELLRRVEARAEARSWMKTTMEMEG